MIKILKLFMISFFLSIISDYHTIINQASAQTKIIIVTGQSLSAGAATVSAITTTQSRNHKKVTGLAYDSTGALSPPYIVRTPTFAAYPWTSLIEVTEESPRTCMANQYYTNSGSEAYLATGSKGGGSYAEIKKGTEAFLYLDRSIESFTSRNSFDGVTGKPQCVGALLMHGESDHQLSTTREQYTANLVELQNDIQQKCLKTGSITEGTTVPLFVGQFSSWTANVLANHATTSPIPLAVQDAARNPTNFGKIIIVFPQYGFPHVVDGVHLTNTSSCAAGTIAGRAMAAGTSYHPLQPHLTESITRVNNVITVPMYVPTCPMALDTTIITGVSSTHRGFEYTCGSSPPSISSVDCTSIACSNNIGYCTITLSGSPNASCQTDDFIGYAITGVNGNSGGPTSGPRGNVVDSSVPVNRLVHFKLSVPQ